MCSRRIGHSGFYSHVQLDHYHSHSNSFSNNPKYVDKIRHQTVSFHRQWIPLYCPLTHHPRTANAAGLCAQYSPPIRGYTRVGLIRSAADRFRTDVKSNTDTKRVTRSRAGLRANNINTPCTADKVPLRASRLFIRASYAVQVEKILFWYNKWFTNPCTY